jgi:Ca2+/H+ antiporter, TMEM165/GDT1 family
MIALYAPAIVVAFVVTMLELTEVVVLVFALGAGQPGVRHGAMGAVAGVAVVGLAALGSGAAILALPRWVLLYASAVLLAAFGVFLFRSTLKTYRRERAAARGAPAPPPLHRTLQFAGGFSVGAVEALEVVVVLLAITAAGYGGSAIVGSVVAGVALVAATLVVHERIRRVKTSWLKLGATAILFSFALFWAGEAYGLRWPGGDLIVAGFFLVSLLAVRGAIEGFLRTEPPAVAVPH